MLRVVRVESVCVSELRCALAVMAPARSAWQDRQAGILSWALRREPSGERERERGIDGPRGEAQEGLWAARDVGGVGLARVGRR